MHKQPTEDILRELICRLLGCHHPPPPVPLAVRWRVASGSFVVAFTGDFKMDLPVDKSVVATIAITDKFGNPAPVDGIPVWSLDNSALVDMTVAADGFSATFNQVPTGALGSTQVKVDCDADLGAGVQSITGLGTINMIAGGAAVVQINFGEPA